MFISETVIKKAAIAKLMNAFGVSLFDHLELLSKVEVLDISLKY